VPALGRGACRRPRQPHPRGPQRRRLAAVAPAVGVRQSLVRSLLFRRARGGRFLTDRSLRRRRGPRC
jgi:hypothetical protein